MYTTATFRTAFKRALLPTAAACALLLGAASAAASTTYVASRAVGAGFVDLSITTDDTLGVLTTGNILDWVINVSRGADSFSLEGPGGLNSSTTGMLGTALTATATDLFFDFSAGGRQAFAMQTPSIGSAMQAWCVATARTCSDDPFAEELVVTDTVFTISSSARVGNQIIASVATGGGIAAVPEPATWALMIGGFGMAGAALRSRRRAALVG